MVQLFSFSQTAEEFDSLSQKKVEQNDYQYAMVLVNKAIEKDSKNQWYYLHKADIQFKLSGPADAIKIIQSAILLDPKNPEPYNHAGVYYDSGGIIDSAIIMYNLAIANATNDTSRYAYILNRGVAKSSKRDFEGAVIDFETVLNFDPENIGALNNISPCYRQLGMPLKGIVCLKKIIALDSTFIGTYINLGFVYSELDSLQLSISFFNKALELDPGEATTYSNRGYVYFKMGDHTSALRDINRSIQLYPTNSYAYRNLALVYIALDKPTEACAALSYALNYGFEQRYGAEVSQLINRYCKK
ncbi:MAG TPA: tetratricopeptide repeat protein [Chitinophagales bacterium]|nr:tetratricopeptide repeat protein [Chitinophagales bacterium]